MGKFLKTLIAGAASGAAAAYFLGTEKGKEVAEKVKTGLNDYKADPESYHQVAREKVAEYKELATSTFDGYKEKWENGELTADSFGQVVKDTVSHVKEKVSKSVDAELEDASFVEQIIEEKTVLENDIIIDLTNQEN